MKILAFETSCDDTAVAVVEQGTKVLASVRIEQSEHSKFGGVVPEIASRLHAENWKIALEKCLADAKITISEVDAIATTRGPGLSPALLSGTTAASFLSLFFKKPVIGVHHIFGHACSVFLDRSVENAKFPSLVLTASGGHTQLHFWRDFCDLKMLGGTIDDAAGEAFDKCSKMCGLGYPGGPQVSKMAESGNENRFDFPTILLDRDSLDFSFSGLKAAVFREIELEKRRAGDLSKNFVADLCASFEATVSEIFLKKVERALEKFPAENVVFVGGVSANSRIRRDLADFLQARKKRLILPAKIEYSTDNAAMIAGAAFFLREKNPKIAKIQFLDADARMEF